MDMQLFFVLDFNYAKGMTIYAELVICTIQTSKIFIQCSYCLSANAQYPCVITHKSAVKLCDYATDEFIDILNIELNNMNVGVGCLGFMSRERVYICQ